MSITYIDNLVNYLMNTNFSKNDSDIDIFNQWAQTSGIKLESNTDVKRCLSVIKEKNTIATRKTIITNLLSGGEINEREF